MPSENRKKFRSIVGKYLAGKADEDESDMVEKYYELFAGKFDRLSELSPEELADVQQRMKGNIRKRTVAAPAKSRMLSGGLFWRAAAAVFVVLGAAWGFFLVKNQHSTAERSVAAKVTHVSAKDQTRFVVLPDGSRVVLHGDARIEYNRDFNQKTREVTLIGEAFFDVVHQNPQGRKPASFVIKTGKIRTTVLGTAFSIKALPNKAEVVVTVTRGKVSVDDGHKKTVLLTANQQMTYDTRTAVTDEKVVKSEELTAWVQADMIFQDIPFGTLAEMLETRYGVKIGFQNPELRKCLITGRFAGTETLEEVFRVLSMTSNTKFAMAGGELTLSGEGCN